MRKRQKKDGMRASFDLDEVLFVSPGTHKTEPPLRFPFKYFYRERLRLGTPDLIRTLRKLGYEVWIYTSSFRSDGYIRRLFRHYGVRLDGIVNGDRHKREVQSKSLTPLPQKMPARYHISLHVDDEDVICSGALLHGFEAYKLDAQDDEWKEKIIACADRIRRQSANGRGNEETVTLKK
ncbi:MAG: HAD family hydrolase [Clostridia bacterium]|nr:HAD family hydrolase [Clostridia bacterium]